MDPMLNKCLSYINYLEINGQLKFIQLTDAFVIISSALPFFIMNYYLCTLYILL